MSETKNIEILFCNNGHQWERAITKGKKPRFCPEHAVTVEHTSTVTLHCEAGHNWERPRTKGKQPKWCPEHKPVALNEAKTEVLICAHDNHEWTRNKRGKAPKFCPEHRITSKIAKANPSGRPNVDLDNDFVLAIINDPTESELKRKMTYVVNEFRSERDWREAGDWRLLHYTFNRLLEEASKVLKQAAPIQSIQLEAI